MEITVNGKPELLNREINLEEFIDDKGLSDSKVAIEYNGEILQPAEWQEVVLTAGDVLEIIKFVGGG
ncbi:sulfur carrier protein ThiS [Fuchsiella alkaliacetigena]|uniref:sulfur carrier protein ThiS n=1 Tax=Fuchsiella alkaliacetigena TaxID=957042 RepID=UPI00200A3549|nr:sulfur carrier protein ThiS [Fuchsiella alkaliacetigena]MCK8825070.1 sulfur carrier protein ThiS [Fuchsiella alkaliacetigena]